VGANEKAFVVLHDVTLLCFVHQTSEYDSVQHSNTINAVIIHLISSLNLQHVFTSLISWYVQFHLVAE